MESIDSAIIRNSKAGLIIRLAATLCVCLSILAISTPAFGAPAPFESANNFGTIPGSVGGSLQDDGPVKYRDSSLGMDMVVQPYLVKLQKNKDYVFSVDPTKGSIDDPYLYLLDSVYNPVPLSPLNRHTIGISTYAQSAQSADYFVLVAHRFNQAGSFVLDVDEATEIQGYVVNKTIIPGGGGNQEKLEGAYVSISRTLSNGNRQGVGETITDSDGNFTFSGLVKGDYSLVVEGPAGKGYLRKDIDDIGLDYMGLYGYQVTLSQPTTMGGTVRNSKGEGLEGIYVFAYEVPFDDSEAEPEYRGYVMTESDGSYLFEDVPDGNYYLQAYDPDVVYGDNGSVWFPVCWDDDNPYPVIAAPFAQQLDLNITMLYPGIVKGFVGSHDGGEGEEGILIPAEGISVKAWHFDGDSYVLASSTTTGKVDSSGNTNFYVRDLVPGQYKIEIDAGKGYEPYYWLQGSSEGAKSLEEASFVDAPNWHTSIEVELSDLVRRTGDGGDNGGFFSGDPIKPGIPETPQDKTGPGPANQKLQPKPALAKSKVAAKLSSNAQLSGLKVSKGKLSKKFKTKTTSYSLKLPAKTASVKLTPQLAQKNAKVQVKVGKKWKTVKSYTVKLKKGKTAKVQFHVTAQDGKTKKVYTVKVSRAKK